MNTATNAPSAANAQPWIARGPAQDACELQLAPLLEVSTDPAVRSRGQLLVLASLLEQTLNVVRNVEAEGSDEGDMLQDLIDQGDAAIKAVLLEQMT
jgi:hypothetical protein